MRQVTWPQFAKFGACWRCATLSVAMLPLSAAALALAVSSLPDAVVLVASIAFGFFVAWAAAHVVAFTWRRLAKPGPADATRPARPCCGRA